MHPRCSKLTIADFVKGIEIFEEARVRSAPAADVECTSREILLRDSPAEQSEPWTATGSAYVYRDLTRALALRQDHLTRNDGDPPDEQVQRLVLEHPGSVAVFAVAEGDRVVCVRQYRHTLRRRFIELPAGICDVAGENPLEVAQRELREEVGLTARHWEPMSTTCPSLGLSTETVRIYLARDLAPAANNAFVRVHEEADMDIFAAPFDALLEAVLGGHIVNAQLVIAVLMFQIGRLRKPDQPQYSQTIR